jgi:sec-independent protein translocase protein TatC
MLSPILDRLAKLPPPSTDVKSEDEMGFLDHLEDLRKHLLKGILGVVIGMAVCLYFGDWVIKNILLAPTNPHFFMYKAFGIEIKQIVLQNRTITGQFFAYWGTIAMLGFIMGLPIMLYQIWKFIEPGLYIHEKKGTRFAAFWASFFFVLGGTFGYLVLLPYSLVFFSTFTIDPNIVNEFDITRYFDMLTMWILGTGTLFEMPVVVYLLSKLRIVNPQMMKKGRRLAIVVIFIIAGIFTPGTDIVSQALMAVPLLFLYELSIIISGYANRKAEKAMQEALK